MTEIKLNINELYLDWLKKNQVEDSQVNFVIFLNGLFHHVGQFIQYEFKVSRDKHDYLFYTFRIMENDNFNCSYDGAQYLPFKTLDELVNHVNQNNVVVWKH